MGRGERLVDQEMTKLPGEAVFESGRDGNPSPEERADFVVKRLEQFIRDSRTIAEGMSFKQWQEMARVEVAKAIIDAENSTQRDDVVTKRLLFCVAAAFVTIGFWGTAFAFDKAHYLLTAIVCGLAGFWLFAIAGEWRIRKFLKRRSAEKRARILRRVESLTRRIRKMEIELKDEAKVLEKVLKQKAIEEAKVTGASREEAIAEAMDLADKLRAKHGFDLES